MWLMALPVLIGCVKTDAADTTALQAWMHNERAKHALPPQPLTAGVPAPAVDQAPAVDRFSHSLAPFNPQRLLQALPSGAPQPTQILPLTFNGGPSQQTKPSLDDLPLASMRLVGSLQGGGEAVALLRVRGVIYVVRVGDKIGQDQGRVSAIELTHLVLREVALNAANQQTERIVTLALVEEPQ